MRSLFIIFALDTGSHSLTRRATSPFGYIGRRKTCMGVVVFN